MGAPSSSRATALKIVGSVGLVTLVCAFVLKSSMQAGAE